MNVKNSFFVNFVFMLIMWVILNCLKSILDMGLRLLSGFMEYRDIVKKLSEKWWKCSASYYVKPI